MESLQRGETGSTLFGEQSAGRRRSDSGTTRADRSGRGISPPARHLAGACTLARSSCSPGNSRGNVRASRDRPIQRRAASRLPAGWVQIRRARPGRIAKREHLASTGCVMNQIRWDREREARTGIPEVVYGPGKTSAHLRQIFEGTTELRIASRLSDEQMHVLTEMATIYPSAR